jgi:hypothetical protein
MSAGLDPERVIAAIPRSDELFLQSLKGKALTAEIPQIKAACRFLSGYREPLSLKMKL